MHSYLWYTCNTILAPNFKEEGSLGNKNIVQGEMQWKPSSKYFQTRILALALHSCISVLLNLWIKGTAIHRTISQVPEVASIKMDFSDCVPKWPKRDLTVNKVLSVRFINLHTHTHARTHAHTHAHTHTHTHTKQWALCHFLNRLHTFALNWEKGSLNSGNISWIQRKLLFIMEVAIWQP